MTNIHICTLQWSRPGSFDGYKWFKQWNYNVYCHQCI